jgi:hypothetical protein
MDATERLLIQAWRQVSGYRTAASSLPREQLTLAERSLKRYQNGHLEDPANNRSDGTMDPYTYRDIPRSG